LRREVPGPQSDEELVRAIRAGDALAPGVLLGRYASRIRSEVRRTLRGVVRRRVGDSDVAQEAWLAAFTSLDEFVDRGPGSFGRWLIQIVRHKARDQVRRHLGAAKRGGKAEISGSKGPRASQAADGAITPKEGAARRESRDRLQRAMARLSPDYRAVLDCVHHQGMTLEQAGEATGRSANATCKVYGRAVRALARLMGEEGTV
jgi:RNA polymerase sigma factor (sigma-70 family)